MDNDVSFGIFIKNSISTYMISLLIYFISSVLISEIVYLISNKNSKLYKKTQ